MKTRFMIAAASALLVTACGDGSHEEKKQTAEAPAAMKVQDNNTLDSTSSGYWSGYWTWTGSSWVWTWVWNSTGGWTPS